jgi:ATP-dependent DNA ligase
LQRRSSITGIIARSAVLDGELALDERGVPLFQALMSGRRAGADRLHFLPFDLLHHNRCYLRALPLEERKAALNTVTAKSGIQVPDEVRGEPEVRIAAQSEAQAGHEAR